MEMMMMESRGIVVSKVMMKLLLLLLLMVVVAAEQSHGMGTKLEEEEGDRITQLPGQPKVSFQQFSGYVTVNHAAGRALFYWLTESSHLPFSKPLVVWLNGGPGCSSVAYGASEEIGPFRINKTASGLYLNPFAWNSLANLLFLESPAGVGFSYSNTSSDILHTGDRRTAEDSLEFLIRWLERFPRYRNREVYLTGESYAGHYVPQLAREIMIYNTKSKRPINLKGIMVGNAVTDNYYDNLGTVTYWWSHAMISDRTYRQLINTCDFRREKESDQCESLYNYAMDQEFGNIDQYNIYAPPCNVNSDGTTTTVAATRHTLSLPHRPRHPIFWRISGYDPCTEKYAEVYYNREDVQKAMHANTTRIPYRWTACSETLNRNWNDTAISILPIYREMIAAGLRVWVFSGDVDSVVPVTATRYSLAQLKLAAQIPWYPWYVKNQVGGWTEVYEGLTFATVRGAGHEVPLFKPRAALQLFESFLRGDPLPKSS
ncbi:serine carboxypeptidase-like 25 isoform X2 [Malania oleifera]|uniref:serine carboxypeptidase-like 25 isoform X2 n=1 Tax=Malania oleifera TaxID=397392 RepID=UPI0025ADB304|nr:serine carboxypeptidase-like 25 isoform X2 [Malania oleifera]